MGSKGTNIELPTFNVLACVLAGNNNDELGNLTTDHPFVELGHDLGDVCFDLVIRCD